MNIRILEPEEYWRLKGTQDNDKWIPSPEYSRVVVAEEDQQIIGFWVMQFQLHAEPVWIRDDKRSGMVLGRMWEKVKEMKVPFYAFSERTDTTEYLERLGLQRWFCDIFHGGA